MRISNLIFTMLLIPILFALQVIAMHHSKEVNDALRLEMERERRGEGQGGRP